MAVPSASSTLVPCLLVIAACIVVRLCVGLHPYSGQGFAPRFGDYEAQRHWMELTINLPPSQWYVQGPHNNLEYWGIDYPPLTAYQSWLCGKVIQWFDPESMALGTSHGYETYYSKQLMRWSVVVCDVLLFFPCVFIFVLTYYTQHPLSRQLWALAVCCVQPPLLLIDHGHFQYNSISLGLTVGAATALLHNHDILASILFTLALNHKQMALYYAPAFFATLLGKSLQHPTLLRKATAVATLGITVLSTCALVWAPWLYPNPSSVLSVLQRIAPVQRGLYEDYVANWWCVSSLGGIKWKRVFTQQQLVVVCAVATAVGFVPAMVHQILRPSKRGFLLCLVNTSMSFFLLSYMVHEKSILLPLLPITLLSLDYPSLSAWLPSIATTSMFPLLLKDRLSLAYIGTLLLWAALVFPRHLGGGAGHYASTKDKNNKAKDHIRGRHGDDRPTQEQQQKQHTYVGTQSRVGEHHAPDDNNDDLPPLSIAQPRWWVLLSVASTIAAVCIHAAHATIPTPARYPFVFDALYSALGFVNVAMTAVYTNVLQWRVGVGAWGGVWRRRVDAQRKRQ